MLVSVIPIGNSKGIRIPKTIIEQLHICDNLDMEIKNHQIILKPVEETPRKNWDILFAQMNQNNDDILEDEIINEAFVWEW